MNQEEIFKKTQKLLSTQFDVSEDKITMQTDIAKDLGADSLDVIDILMSVEDEFKIEVPDEDAENVKTVEQMVEYVKNKLKVGSAENIQIAQD